MNCFPLMENNTTQIIEYDECQLQKNAKNNDTFINY